MTGGLTRCVYAYVYSVQCVHVCHLNVCMGMYNFECLHNYYLCGCVCTVYSLHVFVFMCVHVHFSMCM